MVTRRGYTQPNNWHTLKRKILRRDHNTCYLCGGSATTTDHVVPIAEGGTHSPSNLAAICPTCHDTKTKAEAQRGRKRALAGGCHRIEQHPGLT